MGHAALLREPNNTALRGNWRSSFKWRKASKDWETYSAWADTPYAKNWKILSQGEVEKKSIYVVFSTLRILREQIYRDSFSERPRRLISYVLQHKIILTLFRTVSPWLAWLSLTRVVGVSSAILNSLRPFGQVISLWRSLAWKRMNAWRRKG
jgi:hypothetical protein